MNPEAYKHTVEELERHYNKKFAPSKEGRAKLLNRGFEGIKGCSDGSILRAADSLMYKTSSLPSLDRLVDETKKEHLKDAKRDDDAQEKRAGSYEKYGDRKPLSKNMRNIMKLMGGGKVTRQEWNLLMQQMYREEKTQDLLGPTAYAALCERQGLDMDAPAFSGGLSELLTEQ